MSRYRMVMISQVPDYERWKAAIEAMPANMVSGVVDRTVYRSVDDPNEVMVELTVDSPDVVEQIVSSPLLRDFLDRAGLEIYPPVFLGEKVDELSRPSH